jgi:hypothetical protein
MEGRGLGITKNPVDKRCVILMDIDKNKLETSPFKLIHFFIKNSKFPLRDFDLLLTERKLPKAFYNSWPEESLCPCGSGKKFKDCCFSKEFIFNRHYKLTFKETIPLKF